jgi:hypothetical protein
MLIADAGRWKGFGETRPEILEKVIPDVELPSAGEARLSVDGCWRMEKMNVLFATRRMHCGWMT